MIEGSIEKQNKKYNENLIYARNRLIAGAGIGFLVTMIASYFWACYQHNISIKIGFNIFWYPIVGLGLTVISFFGAIFGAITSLFTKKWKEKNL